MAYFQNRRVLSVEELKAKIIREHRNRFKGFSSMKTSKWSRGRCYCVQDDCIFIIYTNFPNLHYLSLEEYSLYYSRPKPIKKYEDDWTGTLLYERSRHAPVPSDFSGENTIKYRTKIRKKFYNIAWQQTEVLTHWTEVEYKCNTVMSLLQCWDSRKFQRLVDYRLRTHFSDFLAYPKCDLYIGLLMACCTDSCCVVDFFAKICKRYHDVRRRQFFAMLPNKCMNFFARHLKKTGHLSTMRERWIGYEDPLLTGLRRRDLELVKLSLEMDCPSALLPPAVSEDIQSLPDERCWSLLKDGLDPTSFNSLEYYISFTDTLVSVMLEDAHAPSALSDCFHLIWRACPTPYLPLMDMMECMNQLIDRAYANEEVLPHREEWRREKERIWRTFEKWFEEDFPHEYKARSLKHLTRYAIRRRCSLHERIERLPLPELLKRYVKLEF